jgi:uncharacterized membrane protein
MTIALVNPKTRETEKTWEGLTAADRSDAVASGSVQALVRVAKGAKDLLFDGHSYAKHEAALVADGWWVVEDIREAVLGPVKPSED